jgi:hypothetical protein
VKKAAVKAGLVGGAVESLCRRLVDLDKKLAKKSLRAAVNDATKAVLWSAKRKVRKRSGLLYKAMGRLIRVKNTTRIVGVVGPRAGFGRFISGGVLNFVGGKRVNPAKYAHLIEYGRLVVVPKKKKVLADKAAGVVFGRAVRAVPPSPFLRPAFDENKAAAVAAVESRVRAGLIEILRRGSRR